MNSVFEGRGPSFIGLLILLAGGVGGGGARAESPMTLQEARKVIEQSEASVPPDWDETRLRGFEEHRAGQKIFDREREKAESLWVEGLERWERQRLKALEEHRKVQKTQSPLEDGPEYREHVANRKRFVNEQEKARLAYLRMQKAARMLKNNKPPVSDYEELGLNQKRPRYDLSKRALYGGKPVAGGARPSAPSFGGGSGSSGGASGGGFIATPPPANFDEFPEPPSDGGYVPPPPMGDEDIPPPPTFEDGDFPPPPPPPPPDFGDFPPPPPPDGF